MTLHIFNPEHDIALASNLANFTAPHAGRQLRHDLGFLPALWAKEGDAIAVDDMVYAQQAFKRFAQNVKRHLGINIDCHPQWVVTRPSSQWQQARSVDPWGWDLALRARLQRCGIDGQLLPSDSQLHIIRQLSHRRTAASLLPQLRCEGTVGEMFECTTVDEVQNLLHQYGHIVMKAPWSSSGRGIRFVGSQSKGQSLQDDNAQPNFSLSTIHHEMQGWLNNLLLRQGSVMVEPYYHKVKDFGMEFESDGCGTITFLGLSLFHTANGAYTGNIIATEDAKRQMMSRYLPLSLLDTVQERICQSLRPVFNGKYRGPFGIDMMVVRHSSLFTLHSSLFMLHPCVEINLRRTMGHAALALTPTDHDVQRAMRIEYADNCYKLRICRIT
jgi:hypothetical protein